VPSVAPHVHATVASVGIAGAPKAPVDRSDTGFNPFGIVALGVGVLVLIILLITFRRR
jgi:hypothetical protein